MASLRFAACGLLAVAALSAQMPPASKPALFEGGRVIVDARRPPVERAAFLVGRWRTRA
jgi:hypothetical protein